jgi:hypothetical protein
MEVVLRQTDASPRSSLAKEKRQLRNSRESLANPAKTGEIVEFGVDQQGPLCNRKCLLKSD